MGLSVSALNRYIPKFLRRERRVSATRTRPIVLSQQRIFILPTRYGVIFALLLFVMLVGSTNYSNSLGFLLTFLLASLGMISILHAYRNLARLTVHAGKAQAVFCGQQARYVLQVDNQHKQNRYAIMFHLVQQTPVMIDVMGFSTANIELTQPTTRRGWLPISTVTIATRYPLGLVQAWSHLNLMTTCLVYPRPAMSSMTMPASSADKGDNKPSHKTGSDDFLGFRNYHPGDSPRHVDWKAFARGQDLLTKQFSDGETREQWLDWEDLQGLDSEERLSQLCRWVIDADAAGCRYGLRLPGTRFDIGLGTDHKHRCLEALALFEIPE